MQGDQQQRVMDEMFSPISQQILPASIEERLALYTLRNDLEDKKQNYKIVKQKFLNYRQFSCKLLLGKRDLIDAYALSYSTLPRKRAQGRIDFAIKDVHYMNREEVKFVTLAFFNDFFSTSFKTIQELIFNPLTIEKELLLRQEISASAYDLSPIIVVLEIPKGKITLALDAKVYEDTREKLTII